MERKSSVLLLFCLFVTCLRARQRGMWNCGESCYFNSVMQCLSVNQDFNAFVVKQNTIDTFARDYSTLVGHLRDMTDPDWPVVSEYAKGTPSVFRRALSTYGNEIYEATGKSILGDYSPPGWTDLLKDLSLKNKKLYDASIGKLKSVYFFDHHVANFYARVVREFFRGEKQQQPIEDLVSRITTKFDTLNVLVSCISLFPEGADTQVTHLVNNWLSGPELLRPILIFSVPAEGGIVSFDLTMRLINSTYSLFAFVVRSGRTKGEAAGHYYAFTKDSTNMWTRYDDDTVSIENIDEKIEGIAKEGIDGNSWKNFIGDLKPQFATPILFFYKSDNQKLQNLKNSFGNLHTKLQTLLHKLGEFKRR